MSGWKQGHRRRGVIAFSRRDNIVRLRRKQDNHERGVTPLNLSKRGVVVKDLSRMRPIYPFFSTRHEEPRWSHKVRRTHLTLFTLWLSLCTMVHHSPDACCHNGGGGGAHTVIVLFLSFLASRNDDDGKTKKKKVGESLHRKRPARAHTKCAMKLRKF